MKPFAYLLVGLLLAPGGVGAFQVQMNDPVLRPGSAPLHFSVREGLEQPVAAVVRDQSGRQVGVLQFISDRDMVWDGHDKAGKVVKPGTYFVEIQSGAHLWSTVVAVDK